MHYNINVSLPLENLNNIIIVLIEEFWQMEFVALFQGQVLVGCVVSNGFCGNLQSFCIYHWCSSIYLYTFCQFMVSLNVSLSTTLLISSSISLLKGSCSPLDQRGSSNICALRAYNYSMQAPPLGSNHYCVTMKDRLLHFHFPYLFLFLLLNSFLNCLHDCSSNL